MAAPRMSPAPCSCVAPPPFYVLYLVIVLFFLPENWPEMKLAKVGRTQPTRQRGSSQVWAGTALTAGDSLLWRLLSAGPRKGRSPGRVN